MVFAIASASSSSEYSWSENQLKSGDLNSSRLSDLKCLFDDRNSRSGSLELDTPYPMEVDTPYSAINQNNVLEVGSIWAYPSIGYGILGISWSRDKTLDIFQNIHIQYLEYGVIESLWRRGAYGIQYVPRVAVKGQVLSDFLADTSTNATLVVAKTPRVKDIPESSNAMENLTPGPRAWRLYTDGASNNDGWNTKPPNGMRAYMRIRQHGKNDPLKSVENGTTIWASIEENVMSSSEQSNVVNCSETEIISDRNIIPYSQYVIESQQAAIQNSDLSAQQDALMLSRLIVLNNSSTFKRKGIFNANVFILLTIDFKKEESRNIDREIALEKRIKQLDNIVFKRDQSAQTVHMLTKPQFFYDHTTKQALGFQNPFYLKKAQQLEPKLYDGNVIKNTSAIVIPDSEETLMLAEESRSKMLLKQKDPMMLEKKVNTTPVDYAVLNQLSQDFEKRFVPQTELSAEQAFWSQNSVNSPEPTLSSRPTKVSSKRTS
ncbi:hypothetical protein Tco_0620670 [Tanacetum coccineum]